MFTGALSGYVLALLLNAVFPGLQLPPENFALVGMAGAIAGIIQAPLMAVFLIMEITGGQELIVPLMIVAALSYLISKRTVKYSLYTMQLRGRSFIPTHDKDKFAGYMVEFDRVLETDFIPVNPAMSLGEMLKTAVVKSKRNLYPVLDNDGSFIGLVSLDDIRTIMFNREKYNKIFVRDLMHKAPQVVIRNRDDFQSVMKKFQQTGAWNLPVIDHEGHYLGFISKSKLLSIYRKKLLELTSE